MEANGASERDAALEKCSTATAGSMVAIRGRRRIEANVAMTGAAPAAPETAGGVRVDRILAKVRMKERLSSEFTSQQLSPNNLGESEGLTS